MAKAFRIPEQMKDGDMVAGVCYAAAAETLIRMAFDNDDDSIKWRKYHPTVIGYLVEVEGDEDEMAIYDALVVDHKDNWRVWKEFQRSESDDLGKEVNE